MIYFCVIICGYLLGSFPTGYLVARMHGVDIFEYGSGNPGAANLKRVLGSKAGVITLIVDFFKGVIAAFLPCAFGMPELSPISGATSIFGHCYPVGIIFCFHKPNKNVFRGGKGVATSFGAFTFLSPLSMLFVIITFLLTYKCSKFSSLSSIVSMISLPVWIVVVEKVILQGDLRCSFVCSPLCKVHNYELLTLSIISALLVIYRHKDNIRRLIESKELSL